MILKIPSRLYKYKNYSIDSLDLLVSDKLYFADPTTFNDPLDCNPFVLNDIDDADELKNILLKLVKENHQKELKKAARKIKYRGPRTLEKIDMLSEIESQRLINDIVENVYHGGNFCNSVIYHIKSYLLKNYEDGVFSLAKKFNCPLMWSHYADQHKGFCIGYDVSDNNFINIHPVDYKGKGFITTQQVHDMLFGSNENVRSAAKKEIYRITFLSKAPSWKYENEYRVISEQGLQDSSLRLSDVTFGLRFKESTKYSVMKTLESRRGKIDFYEMSLSDKPFKLKRRLIDLEDIKFDTLPEYNYEYYHDSNRMCNESDLYP